AGQLEAALTDGDREVPDRSIRALAIWAGKENIPALARLLEGMNTPGHIRQQAITILSKFPDEQAAAILTKCLNNGGDRNNAAQALQGMGPTAEKELLKYLNDPMANQDGRNEAGRVLKALGSKENVGVNLALAGLKDNDPGRRREAADTLAKMPAPDKG